MKKKVSDFLAKLGCTTQYSGNDRTIYVEGPNAKEAIDKVHKRFVTLSFSVKLADTPKTPTNEGL